VIFSVVDSDPVTPTEPVTFNEPVITWFPTKVFEPVVANELVFIV